MYKVGILPNIKRDINLDYTNNLVNWLNAKDCAVFVSEKHDQLKNAIIAPIETICNECDFVIFLGGDGTILQKISTCARYNIPLIGINLGSVGYLADVDRNDGIEAIEKVLNKNFEIDKRMLIRTLLDNVSFPALNDICVIKSDQTKLLHLKLSINNEYIDTYRGDGIIISTPTGSTAYNMAAGGPIIKPDANAIVVTPIAPYKIYSRPLVLSGDDTIGIECQEYTDALLSIDGVIQDMRASIVIDRSIYTANIIRTNKQNFYDVLRKKFFTS